MRRFKIGNKVKIITHIPWKHGDGIIVGFLMDDIWKVNIPGFGIFYFPSYNLQHVAFFSDTDFETVPEVNTCQA